MSISTILEDLILLKFSSSSEFHCSTCAVLNNSKLITVTCLYEIFVFVFLQIIFPFKMHMHSFSVIRKNPVCLFREREDEYVRDLE